MESPLNIHHYWDLIHFTIHAPRWKDKFKVWISYPGWKPSYMMNYKYPSEKNQSYNLYQKYDTIIPKDLSLYTLIWFIIIVFGTFLFLLNHTNLNYIEKFMIIFIIIFSLVSISGI